MCLRVCACLFCAWCGVHTDAWVSRPFSALSNVAFVLAHPFFDSIPHSSESTDRLVANRCRPSSAPVAAVARVPTTHAHTCTNRTARGCAACVGCDPLRRRQPSMGWFALRDRRFWRPNVDPAELDRWLDTVRCRTVLGEATQYRAPARGPCASASTRHSTLSDSVPRATPRAVGCVLEPCALRSSQPEESCHSGTVTCRAT